MSTAFVVLMVCLAVAVMLAIALWFIKKSDQKLSNKTPQATRPEAEAISEQFSVIDKNILEIKNVLNIRVEKERTKSVFDELSRRNERKGLSDADKTLIGNGFDGLKKQIAQISENLEKTGQSSDVLLKAVPSLDIVKDALGIVQTLKSAEQMHKFSDIDKGFFTENFSQLANRIDASIKNVLIDNSQTEELSRVLNVESDKFIQKLKEILDAQGYKECVNCSYSVVPKNAKFCPNCGASPDIKTASEST